MLHSRMLTFRPVIFTMRISRETLAALRVLAAADRRPVRSLAAIMLADAVAAAQAGKEREGRDAER